MDDEKFPKKSVSFRESVIAAAQEKADRHHAGNFSRYIQTVVERDLEGSAPTPTSKDPLVTLTRAFHPTLAAPLELQLNKHGDHARPVSQARVIARLIEALSHALEGNLDPERELAIVDAAKAREWEKISDHRVITAGEALAKILNKDGGAALLKLIQDQKHQLNEDSDTADPRSKGNPATSPADEEIEAHRRRKVAEATDSGAHAKRTRIQPKSPKG